MPQIQPPPFQQDDISFVLKNWLKDLYEYVAVPGERIPWSQINKEGSDLADIQTRLHSSLQGILGSGQHHLSETEFDNLVRSTAVTTTVVSTSINDAYGTYVVTATGQTLTLPSASTNIGKTWTIILAVNGYVDIARSGSDTLNLPTNDTVIRLNNKGASVSLRATSATSWSIV